MIAHVMAFEGNKTAKSDQASGMEQPCYVFGYPAEFVRAYCLAYGYDSNGNFISKN